MSEKETEEIVKRNVCGDCNKCQSHGYIGCDVYRYSKDSYLYGLRTGYNKANEWHFVKDKLPIRTDSTLCELMPVFVAVKVGYKVSTYGTYWNLRLGKFECLDEVYAWCYTPEPPELKESE